MKLWGLLSTSLEANPSKNSNFPPLIAGPVLLQLSDRFWKTCFLVFRSTFYSAAAYSRSEQSLWDSVRWVALEFRLRDISGDYFVRCRASGPRSLPHPWRLHLRRAIAFSIQFMPFVSTWIVVRDLWIYTMPSMLGGTNKHIVSVKCRCGAFCSLIQTNCSCTLFLRNNKTALISQGLKAKNRSFLLASLSRFFFWDGLLFLHVAQNYSRLK